MLLLKTTYICSLVIVVMNLAHKIFIKEFISVDELSQIRMTVRCRKFTCAKSLINSISGTHLYVSLRPRKNPLMDLNCILTKYLCYYCKKEPLPLVQEHLDWHKKCSAAAQGVHDRNADLSFWYHWVRSSAHLPS